MKRALIYLFTFLATQYVALFLVFGAYMLIAKGDPQQGLPAEWEIAFMVVYSIFEIIVFVTAGWFQLSRTYLKSHPWSVVAWSVVAAMGAIIPSMFLQELLPQWTGWAEEMARENAEVMGEIMMKPGGYLVVALLPPVVEEMVFRGCILRSLLAWKPQRRWLMIALSALIFALVHLNPAQLVHTFLIGLLLGWMYMRTRSIVPGIAYHWANNTIAYVLFHLYHNPETMEDIFGTGNLRLILALLFSLCIFVPALVQLHWRMRRVDDGGTGLQQS